MAENWHAMSVDQVLSALKSSRDGLSKKAARRRLSEHGPNRLITSRKTPGYVLFFRQFLSPLIYVLLVAAGVSALSGHYLDAAVILGVLLLNAIIGYVQESQAQKAMEALMRMAAPRAQVKRDSDLVSIQAESVVPGDVIYLEAGNRVPADARIIEEASLKVNESSLTGESVAVDKDTDAVDADASLGEQSGMVHMGTIVTYGHAWAVVVRTGMESQMGRIASTLDEERTESTPIQRSIGSLSKYIVVVVVVILALLVISGLLRGLPPLEIVLLAAAASVAAIPEGLPAAMTVILAIGMRLMARENAIIRRLVAVETLGSATVICSDKTGTLTANEMTVRKVYVNGQMVEVTGEGYEVEGGKFLREGESLSVDEVPGLDLLLRTGVLCNDASLNAEDRDSSVMGDPTEISLLVVGAKAGLDKDELSEQSQRAGEIPFESEQQYMAVAYHNNGGIRVYVKGSVEKVLSMSSDYLDGEEKQALNDRVKEEVNAATDSLAGNAMRVLAFAYADLPSPGRKLKYEDIDGALTFVGLAGMADPPREEVKQAIKQCGEAGVRVLMVTGDHKATASAIAAELDLPAGRAVEGRELNDMSDEELATEIEDISVFARIEPAHKHRIVTALKKNGHIVAMTGDGVNDAPALKAANIGVAMGQSGTDVAKEAADMVLADDDFATIVVAIAEGRAIFNRLRNVILFLLSTNVGELLALVLTVALIGKAPLTALQIIWVNLVTETVSAIPLGLEKKSGQELQQPPRHPSVGLVYPGLVMRLLFLAAIMGVGIFTIFRWADPRMPLDEARTLAFCTMVAFEWFRAFNARSDERTVWSLGFFSNRYLLLGIGAAILLQLGAVYLPFAQVAFDTVPLAPGQWAIALAAGGSLFILEETRKLIAPRLFSRGKWNPAGWLPWTD